MSQTATLSDFPRTSFDAEAVFCGFENDPKSRSTLSAVSNGLWELTLTACMLVLAPLALFALAGAFVFACLRLHASEIGADCEAAINHPPVDLHDVRRRRLTHSFDCEHLWN
jgi:hypothetical protein